MAIGGNPGQKTKTDQFSFPILMAHRKPTSAKASHRYLKLLDSDPLPRDLTMTRLG